MVGIKQVDADRLCVTKGNLIRTIQREADYNVRRESLELAEQQSPSDKGAVDSATVPSIMNALIMVTMHMRQEVDNGFA